MTALTATSRAPPRRRRRPSRQTVSAANGSTAVSLNIEVAARLDELASLLREQEASSFRVGAYTRAAAVVRALPESVQDLYAREGLDGLEQLPGVGPVISRAIREVVLTGRIPMLERLRGQRDAGRLLETVPGIGQRLAQRLREEHGLETLEDLEAAAHDGTLAGVAGFGTKRIRGIQEALAWRLGRARRLPASGDDEMPPVAELLDVDREYREKAAAGLLRRIAPRRFNPTGEAWLPVLHTQRGNRHYTALFSNTAQAHRLGRTADWVVLFYDGTDGERQATVVTARTGPRKGERVVRTTSGREGL